MIVHGMMVRGRWVSWVAAVAGIGLATFFQSNPRWIPTPARAGEVRKKSPAGFLASVTMVIFIGFKAVFDTPHRRFVPRNEIN
jgi:hypothetical protein